MKRLLLILILISTIPLASTAFAGKGGKDAKNSYREEQEYRSAGDRGNHYGWTKNKGAVKNRPPEGWRKRIVKGKHIDDEFSVFLEDVPRAIVRTLPPLPAGVSYKRIENDIIKLHNANMEILEVFRDFGVPVPVLPKIK